MAVTTADVTGFVGTVEIILLNLNTRYRLKKFWWMGVIPASALPIRLRIFMAYRSWVKHSKIHKSVVLFCRWMVDYLFVWLDKFHRF